MLKVFRLDLHVHSCLSPCAELDMHPQSLAEGAVAAGLDAMAVCDHNSTENLPACMDAGRRAGLYVIPGIEITSEEEVHILGLLPDLEAADQLQAEVYAALPAPPGGPGTFGLQVIANDRGEVLDFNRHFLSGATQLSVDEVVNRVHQAGGLAVASHADREAFGIIGQLGFVPPDLPLDAIEASLRLGLREARNRFRGQFGILCSSDAHQPDHIGRCLTYMLLKEPSLPEIRRALAGEDGRAILGGGKPMEELALHVLDIAQNALEARATRLEIEIAEEPAENRLTIQVADNGKGMDQAVVGAVLDPFFTTRTTRRVGLGLSLLAEAARNADGDLEVCSQPGIGTTVKAHFRLDHIDRAPLGDLQTTLLVLLVGSPEAEILFRHVYGARDFAFSSRDLAAALDSTSLCSPEGLALFRELFEQGEAELRSGDRVTGWQGDQVTR